MLRGLIPGIVVIAAVCIGLLLLDAYSRGERIGREAGRREQAALTPAACREMQRIAGEALENSDRMAKGWLACDFERATLAQRCGKREQP